MVGGWTSDLRIKQLNCESELQASEFIKGIRCREVSGTRSFHFVTYGRNRPLVGLPASFLPRGGASGRISCACSSSRSRRGGGGRRHKIIWDWHLVPRTSLYLSWAFFRQCGDWGGSNHSRAGAHIEMAFAESEPLLKSEGLSEEPELLQRTTSQGGEPLQRTSSQGGEPLQRTWSQGQVKQWAEWAQFVVEAVDDGPVEVDPSEIREAATQDPYPQWIYGALVTPANSGELDPPLIYGEVITPENSGQLDSSLPIPHAVEGSIPPDVMSTVQGLHEDEIRELIVEYVDHRCCWGKRPASKWSFKKIENCNAFIGALESFIEERESYPDVEPYTGQQHTTAEHGRQQGTWEVDMRDEFPWLFTVKKEVKSAIPFSQRVEVCKTCSGKKEVPCPECHSIDESGSVGPRKTAPCTVCHGRGLIAHQDGSDTNCEECKGTGMQECKQCGPRGVLKCPTCNGYGSLLYSQILVARWRTLINKIISASSHAATLPDDVLHEAGGIDLHTDQSHTCQPVQFVNSYGLTKLSADVFATREEIPPTSRLIVERHQLRLIPVTHVVMSDGDRSFQFYIVGLVDSPVNV